ncbi:hypothetical protein Bbelb_080320 [Branchiostoma belcheri]|nr:hypothetical protein Bbelb_080320 [Branchiostoma belcheri]
MQYRLSPDNQSGASASVPLLIVLRTGQKLKQHSSLERKYCVGGATDGLGFSDYYLTRDVFPRVKKPQMYPSPPSTLVSQTRVATRPRCSNTSPNGRRKQSGTLGGRPPLHRRLLLSLSAVVHPVMEGRAAATVHRAPPDGSTLRGGPMHVWRHMCTDSGDEKAVDKRDLKSFHVSTGHLSNFTTPVQQTDNWKYGVVLKLSTPRAEQIASVSSLFSPSSYLRINR